MVHHGTNGLLRELETMTAIARVLGTLDPAARERVIRWAVEKFQVEISATSALAAIGAPARTHEQTRDELNDLLDTPAAAAEVRGKEPIDALVRELAADFQRLALESNGA